MATTAIQASPADAQRIFKLMHSGSRVQFFKTIKETKQKIPISATVDMTMPSILTFTDKDGTIQRWRYISNVPELDYYAQIDKAGKFRIPENYKLTRADRRDLMFFKSTLIADVKRKPHLVRFLSEEGPLNKDFTGLDRGNHAPMIEEYRPAVERKRDVNFGFKQAGAIMAIHKLFSDGETDELDSKLLEIYGPHLALPEDAEDKVRLLISAVNDAVPETGEMPNGTNSIDIILADKKADTIDVVIGKAVSAKIIAFDQKNDEIMINRKGSKSPKFETLRKISADAPIEEKYTQFRDWLLLPDGQSAKDAIIDLLKPKIK